MPFPNVEQAEKYFLDKEQVYAFIAQLKLQKHLERVHKELYQQRCQESTSDYLHTVNQFINRCIEVDTPALDSALSNSRSLSKNCIPTY